MKEIIQIELFNEMPEKLRTILEGSRFSKNNTGCSNSRVYHIQNLEMGGSAYLKVVFDPKVESLEREVEILKWLKGKLPVPEVYYFGQHQGKEFLLMSEVNGLDASSGVFKKNPEKMVTIIAEGLRKVHAIDISDCPFDQRLEKKIQNAKYNVDHRLVDEEGFQPEHLGMRAGELYELVVEKKPEQEDLVFTHGDYCLPNVIINNDKLSGFIDLGRAGVADRYQDLALGFRTLKYNLGSESWAEMFLDFYGIEDVDYAKIEYYILLDELF